jgi:hypothetical protein
MIAFTNHALDHLLASVLEASITKKIARLGSRSAHEVVSQYSIEKLEEIAITGRERLRFGNYYRDLKKTEEKIRALMKSFSHQFLSSQQMVSHLQTQHPEHYEHLQTPPPWITVLHRLMKDEEDEGWEEVGKASKSGKAFKDNSVYSFWRLGKDIEFLTLPPPVSPTSDPTIGLQPSNTFQILSQTQTASPNGTASPSIAGDTDSNDELDGDGDAEAWEHGEWHNAEHDMPLPPPSIPSIVVDRKQQPLNISDLQDPETFFAKLDVNHVPQVSDSHRPLEDLLDEGTIWTMSLTEREQLHGLWHQEAKEALQSTQLDEYNRLRSEHTRLMEMCDHERQEVGY